MPKQPPVYLCGQAVSSGNLRRSATAAAKFPKLILLLDGKRRTAAPLPRLPIPIPGSCDFVFYGMELANFGWNPTTNMIHEPMKHLLAAAFAMFALSGAFAQAHPGPPGHTHFPDEVDEFDQTVAVRVESPAKPDFDLGGMLVLAVIVGCLAYALFQKDGGIWSDTTSKH
jgi:hypothetical protein